MKKGLKVKVRIQNELNCDIFIRIICGKMSVIVQCVILQYDNKI